MKRHFILIFLLAAGLSANAFAQESTKTITVSVTNNWSNDKIDEPVVIDIHKINTKFKVKSAVVSLNDKEIPSQIDDLNKDARFDEIAFVADIPAKCTKTFKVVLSSEKSNKVYPARTYAEMMAYSGKSKKEYITGFSGPGGNKLYSFTHHHGPAFESELVAYRIYFNDKQTVDPYGKFTKQLEIKESQFYPTDEQLKRGFGDDVLRVNNSCGIGTLKGWDGTSAMHISPVVERTERVIASGPVRAIVEADVIGWEYQGKELNLINRYTLYAGHRDILVEAIFDEALSNETFSSGVQKLKEYPTMMSDHKGLVGSWGTDFPVNDTVKYAKETVGIGTFIPKEYCGKETADNDNYLYVISAPKSNRFHYYTTFTSKKETFGFKDDNDWYAYLKEWKKSLENPCTVKIKQ